MEAISSSPPPPPPVKKEDEGAVVKKDTGDERERVDGVGLGNKEWGQTTMKGKERSGIRAAKIRRIRKTYEKGCIGVLHRMRSLTQQLVELSTETAMHAAKFEKKLAHQIASRSITHDNMWLITGGVGWLKHKQVQVEKCLGKLVTRHEDYLTQIDLLDAADTALDHV